MADEYVLVTVFVYFFEAHDASKKEINTKFANLVFSTERIREAFLVIFLFWAFLVKMAEYCNVKYSKDFEIV